MVGYAGRGQAGDGVVAIMMEKADLLSVFGCSLLIGCLMYFWHLWRCCAIEEAFEKRYDEAEAYWSDLRITHRGDFNLAKARIAKLEAENDDLTDKLGKALAGEMTVESIRADRDECKIVLGHRMAGIMAETFYDWLEKVGAENYIEAQFNSPKGDRITVTVQRFFGKSPHELRREAEEKLDKVLRNNPSSAVDTS